MNNPDFALEQVKNLGHNEIRTRKDQPRTFFDDEALAELAASIKEKGLQQPIIVRRIVDDRFGYELVAGERRFRASKIAGMPGIPAIVRHLSDQEAGEAALIENLHREDLNPVEEVYGVLNLIAHRLSMNVDRVPSHLWAMKNTDAASRSHEDIAVIEEVFSAIGKPNWQSFVSNKLPLINLPENILKEVKRGNLSYNKAKIINRIKDESVRDMMLRVTLEGEVPFRHALKKMTAIADYKRFKFDRDIFQRMGKVRSEYKKRPQPLTEEKQRRLAELLEEVEDLLED